MATPTVRLLKAVSVALLAASAAFCTAVAQEPPHSAELDAAIIRAAKRHGVPEHLVRRIVMRESRYNPRARNHSFWGLMQISYPTARSMGFKGTPEQLLNPVTNLAYAVPYLANAFVAAGKREDAAVRLYARGYYATAKNRGVLDMLRTADSAPLNGVPDEPISGPATVASDTSVWSLFGASAPAAAPVEPQQQLAYAAPDSAASAPAQAQIAAIAREPSSRGTSVATKGGDGVAMVQGRNGAMVPPKRWQHDGGTSVIVRGEQGLERVAAYRIGDRAVASARRSRKTTVFAQLDGGAVAAAAPTATDAQPQPTSFYAAALQTPAADTAQPAAPQVAAADTADPASAATNTDTAVKSKRRRHHHR